MDGKSVSKQNMTAESGLEAEGPFWGGDVYAVS